MNDSFQLRPGQPEDEAGANYICLRTGDHGADGAALFADDPDCLGRIYAAPYLAFEPELSLMLEDAEGLCGYAFAALDSRRFFDRYEREWRPKLCAQFPEPSGPQDSWTPTQEIHYLYHHPEYFCPEDYDAYPSHAHIDLMERAQGHGFGRRMMQQLLDLLRSKGSPGVFLGVSIRNDRAMGFYKHLGFHELARDDGAIYIGMRLDGE